MLLDIIYLDCSRLYDLTSCDKSCDHSVTCLFIIINIIKKSKSKVKSNIKSWQIYKEYYHFTLYCIITVSSSQGFSSEETSCFSLFCFLLFFPSLSLYLPKFTSICLSCCLFPWYCCHNSWLFFLLDLFLFLYLSHSFFPIFYTISIAEIIYFSPDIFFYSIITLMELVMVFDSCVQRKKKATMGFSSIQDLGHDTVVSLFIDIMHILWE